MPKPKYEKIEFDKDITDQVRIDSLNSALSEALKRQKEKVGDSDVLVKNARDKLYLHASEVMQDTISRYGYSTNPKKQAYACQVLERIRLAVETPEDAENTTQLALLSKEMPGVSIEDKQFGQALLYFAAAVAFVVVCLTFMPSGGASILGIYGVGALIIAGAELGASADRKENTVKNIENLVRGAGLFQEPPKPITEKPTEGYKAQTPGYSDGNEGL